METKKIREKVETIEEIDQNEDLEEVYE